MPLLVASRTQQGRPHDPPRLRGSAVISPLTGKPKIFCVFAAIGQGLFSARSGAVPGFRADPAHGSFPNGKRWHRAALGKMLLAIRCGQAAHGIVSKATTITPRVQVATGGRMARECAGIRSCRARDRSAALLPERKQTAPSGGLFHSPDRRVIRQRLRRAGVSAGSAGGNLCGRAAWCGWGDSNSHALRRSILSALRLPFRHTRLVLCLHAA